ncbi:MAG: hypothetical protein JWO29_668 [Arthrobacter sp.]|nr:hypothetical protein [Arthrobacter sp.]
MERNKNLEGRRARVAGILTLSAVAVTAGGLAAINWGPLTAGPAANPTGGVMAPTASGTLSATPVPDVAPSASVSGTAAALPTAPAPVPPAEEWRTFRSPGGKVSFEYPPDWNVAAPKGAAGSPAVDVDVSDADGMVVASLHYGPSGGIGGTCRGAVPYAVLDSVELALPYNAAGADTIPPRFAFRSLQEPGRITASYGITSSLAGRNGKSCMFYNVVSGPAESPLYSFADAFQVNVGGAGEAGDRKGAKTFATVEEAKAYMQTAEYRNAKRMITSLKIGPG